MCVISFYLASLPLIGIEFSILFFFFFLIPWAWSNRLAGADIVWLELSHSISSWIVEGKFKLQRVWWQSDWPVSPGGHCYLVPMVQDLERPPLITQTILSFSFVSLEGMADCLPPERWVLGEHTGHTRALRGGSADARSWTRDVGWGCQPCPSASAVWEPGCCCHILDSLREKLWIWITIGILPIFKCNKLMEGWMKRRMGGRQEGRTPLTRSGITVLARVSSLWRRIQFSLVAQSCPTLWDPMNRSTSGLPVHHQLPESIQTHVHCVSDAIQPSHPLLSPSPPAPNPSQHQGLFKWVSSPHQVAKVLEFHLQHQSLQWTPRTDLL